MFSNLTIDDASVYNGLGGYDVEFQDSEIAQYFQDFIILEGWVADEMEYFVCKREYWEEYGETLSDFKFVDIFHSWTDAKHYVLSNCLREELRQVLTKFNAQIHFNCCQYCEIDDAKMELRIKKQRVHEWKDEFRLDAVNLKFGEVV